MIDKNFAIAKGGSHLAGLEEEIAAALKRETSKNHRVGRRKMALMRAIP
jgi:hypothetical protein